MKILIKCFVLVLLAANAFGQRVVTVTAPNGGETIVAGTTYHITWTQSGGTFNSFTIDLSRNGGSSWTTLASGLPGNYTYRDLSLPAPASTTCRIRVTGYYTGGSVSDQSNSNFALVGTINITFPTSGTTLWKGHTYYFTWNSQNVNGNVRVQMLRSGGLYYTLAANDPNDGSLQFVAPFGQNQTPGYTWPEDGNYRVRIEALDGTGTATSGYFSIARPTLDVTYPDGGQTMYQGSTINITWTNNQVESGQPILLQWYRGSTASTLITASAPNTGSYQYTIPCAFQTGTDLRIGMSAYSGEVSNFSANYNTIAVFPAPGLSTPANGSNLQGPPYVFAWNSVSGADAYHIKIATEPTFSNPIVNDLSIPGSSTSYSYSGSLTWGTTHYWQMQALEGSCWGAWSAYRSFIPAPVPGIINIIFPTAGTTLWKGHTYYITWSSQNVTGNIRVKVLRNGSDYYTLAANDPNDGSLEFIVPFGQNQTPGYSWPEDGNYQVRVEALNGNGSATTGYFSILRPTITVTNPNGGQTMYRGQNITITWIQSQVETGEPILIQWYHGSTPVEPPITTSAPNTGSYSWTIPCSFATATDYLIGMSAYDGEVWDFSATSNTIAETPATSPVSPSIGSTLQGPPYVFTWNAVSGATQYRIKVSTNPDMSSPVFDTDTIPGTQTSYTYNNYLQWNAVHYWQVRALRYGCWGAWPAVWSFTPQSVPMSITVTSPNGGENWSIGETRNITWTTSGPVGNVQIHLYRISSEGPMVCSIAAGAPNTGSLAWTIPPETATHTDYLIGISQAGSGDPSDFSNAWFTINGASLTLTSPNGGEHLTMGQPWQIQWTSTGSIGTVHVELYQGGTSHDNALRVLNGAVPNTGTLLWNPVDSDLNPACNYYIGISDNGDGSPCNGSGDPWDFSNSAFCIDNLQESITVTSPNGGENWAFGETHNITWTSNGPVGNVQVHLYRNGTDPDHVVASLAAGDPNDGVLPWTILPLYPTGGGYYIGISEAGTGDPWDFSNAPFTLSGQSYPIPTHPVDGELLVGPPYVFQWTAMPGADQYRLKVSTVSDFSTTIIDDDEIDGSLTSRSYTDFMEWGNTHYWQIQPIYGVTPGVWSPVEEFVPVGSLIAAPALNSPANGASISRTTTFSWNTVSGASGYRLRIYTDPQGTNSVFENAFTQSTNNSSISIPSQVTDGSTGYWRMRSVDAGNGRMGAWSTMRSFTVGSVPSIPGTPNALTPSNETISSTPVTFAWASATGASSYVVQYSNASTFNPASSWSGTGTTTQIPFALVMEPQLKYWRVAGVNTAGQGPWSQTRSFTYSATETGPLTSVVITSPAPGININPQTTYISSGRATGNYNGVVSFHWHVNGIQTSSGSASMTPTGGATIPGVSFATGDAGTTTILRLEVCASGNCLNSGDQSYNVVQPSYGPAAYITLEAEPSILQPSGASIITAFVRDAMGRRVTSDNGRSIHFTAPEGAFLNNGWSTTTAGVATNTYTAPSHTVHSLSVNADPTGLSSATITLCILDTDQDLARHDQYRQALQAFGYNSDYLNAIDGWVTDHIRTAEPDGQEIESFSRLLLTEKFLAHAIEYENGMYGDNGDSRVVGVEPVLSRMSEELLGYCASVAELEFVGMAVVIKGASFLPDRWVREALQQIHDGLMGSVPVVLNLAIQLIPDRETRAAWSYAVNTSFAAIRTAGSSLIAGHIEPGAAIDWVVAQLTPIVIEPQLRKSWTERTDPVLQRAGYLLAHPESAPELAESQAAYAEARAQIASATQQAQNVVENFRLTDDAEVIEQLLSQEGFIERIGRQVLNFIMEVLHVDAILDAMEDLIHMAKSAAILDSQGIEAYRIMLEDGLGQSAAFNVDMVRQARANSDERILDECRSPVAQMNEPIANLETMLGSLQSAIIAGDTAAARYATSEFDALRCSLFVSLDVALAPVFASYPYARTSLPSADSLVAQAMGLRNSLRFEVVSTLLASSAFNQAPYDTAANVDSIADDAMMRIALLRERLASTEADVDWLSTQFAAYPADPFLIVTRLAIPDSVGEDQPFAVGVTVLNAGGSMMESGGVKLRCSHLESVSPADSVALPVLAGGEEYSTEFVVTTARITPDTVAAEAILLDVQPITVEGISFPEDEVVFMDLSAGFTLTPVSDLTVLVTGDSIQLNWSAIQGAMYYNVYAGDDATFVPDQDHLVASTSTNSFVHEGITQIDGRKFYLVTAVAQ